MKIILKKIVPAALLASSLIVPLNAAEEKYEEFARQFMPQIQKINEQLREECGNAKRLRAELEEKIKEMLPETMQGNGLDRSAYFALRQKINEQSREERGNAKRSKEEKIKEKLLEIMQWNVLDHSAYFALCKKIEILDVHEIEWAENLRDCYVKHKANLVSSEKLAENDNIWTKQAQAWKKEIVDKVIRNEIIFKNMFIQVVQVPFCNWLIGKYEVTQAQYFEIMKKNPSQHKGDNLPVENVTWNEAVKFCKNLTEIARNNGTIGKNLEYRLPTFAEWEYACRANFAMQFDYSVLDGSRARWYNNPINTPHHVGIKWRNRWGIYDMRGNVWEWRQDSWGSGGSRNSFRNSPKYCYGGDSYDEPRGRMVYVREINPNDFRRSYLGFRVVLAPVENR